MLAAAEVVVLVADGAHGVHRLRAKAERRPGIDKGSERLVRTAAAETLLSGVWHALRHEGRGGAGEYTPFAPLRACHTAGRKGA